MNKISTELINLGQSILNKITIEGTECRPHLHIQSSVHGAEILGNGVINELVKRLKMIPITGKITMIPEANPFAKNNKAGTYTTGRFCPVTGDNWNRMYSNLSSDKTFKEKIGKLLKTEEEKSTIIQEVKKLMTHTIDELSLNDYGLSRGKKLCLELQRHSSQADIFLDLHTGPVATDYLYVPKRQETLALSYPIANQIIIPNEFDGAGDEAFFSPWSYVENLLGESFFHGEAYTVELGSEENFSRSQIDVQTDKLVQFLHHREIIQNKLNSSIEVKVNQRPLESFKTYYSPIDGLVDFLKKPGEKSIERRASLHHHQLRKISNRGKTETITANSSGVIINRCPSSRALNGMELYQVLEG